MAFCNQCGAQIPDGNTTCTACASRIPSGPASVAPAQRVTDNSAGLLAYFVIPAIVFLIVEPYNRNKFVRFHSFQSLFLFATWIVIHLGLTILGMVPFLGLLTIPVHFLVGIGFFILWIVLLIKANQGQMSKVPFIGNIAVQQADAR